MKKCVANPTAAVRIPPCRLARPNQPMAMPCSMRTGERPAIQAWMLAAVMSIRPATAPAFRIAGAARTFSGSTATEHLLPPGLEQYEDEDCERYQRQRVGSLAAEERVLRLRPRLYGAVELCEHAGEERDQDAGDRATRDVAGRHEHARALVALGRQLLGRELL